MMNYDDDDVAWNVSHVLIDAAATDLIDFREVYANLVDAMQNASISISKLESTLLALMYPPYVIQEEPC